MRALLAMLLLVSCVTVAKPTPTAPPYADTIARALCDRNATYVAGHIGGRLASVDEATLREYFGTLATCTAVRFIAADSGGFLFVLTEADHAVPYLFTFDADLRCVDVR